MRQVCWQLFGPQLFGFVMERGLGELILPGLASIGVATLFPRARIVPPAIVFCDCPSVALWFASGFGLGLALGIALICGGAALLRPPAVCQSRPPAADEFHDAVEVLAPPVVAYRPWRR